VVLLVLFLHAAPMLPPSVACGTGENGREWEGMGVAWEWHGSGMGRTWAWGTTSKKRQKTQKALLHALPACNSRIRTKKTGRWMRSIYQNDTPTPVFLVRSRRSFYLTFVVKLAIKSAFR
jgi:hypothetical protein